MSSTLWEYNNAVVVDEALAEKSGINQTDQVDFFSGDQRRDANGEDGYMDPLITGYAFIIWTRLPKWLEKATTKWNFRKLTQTNFRALDGISDIELSTEGIQSGFTATEHSFAKGTQKWNEFTLKHREFSGSPVMHCYRTWITGIRDPRTGIATYVHYGEEKEYKHYNHSAEMMYILTRPDANNWDAVNMIEYACYFTDVIPTKIPLGHLNHAAGDNPAHELDIPFKATPHMGPEVETAALKLLKDPAARKYNFIFEHEWIPLSGNIEAGATAQG